MATFTVPFDKKIMLTWYKDPRATKQIEPYEFSATLRYKGFERGRSSLNIEWEDLKSGITYYSAMSMLNDALRGSLIQGDCLVGTFGFYKQGTAILLKRL